MPKKKVNLPKKGAGRKLTAQLKNLRNQRPSTDSVKKINQVEAGDDRGLTQAFTDIAFIVSVAWVIRGCVGH